MYNTISLYSRFDKIKFNIVGTFAICHLDAKIQTFQHPDTDELAVEDLKDLLLTSIQNTVSLNDLVTQLTQKIVNIMLS